MEGESRCDDDDKDHPGPVARVQADVEVGERHGAGCHGGAELPETPVVPVDRERRRPQVDKEGYEEGDGGLVQPVEHEGEELDARPLEAEDAATIQLREGE